LLLFSTAERITDLNEIAQHIVTKDSASNILTGGKNYRMHLPPDIPARNFWSVIVYDNETGMMIHTDQSWPSVFSSSKKLIVNQDGSVDVWFGPKAPAGKENNWIQTITGKSWKMILRLYDPTETWVNGTWKPGEIEEMK
jgi:hypothetical protein